MLFVSYHTYSTFKAQVVPGDVVYYQSGSVSDNGSFSAWVVKMMQVSSSSPTPSPNYIPTGVLLRFVNPSNPAQTPPTFLTDFPGAILGENYVLGT